MVWSTILWLTLSLNVVAARSQMSFKKQNIQVDGHSLLVEIAETSEQQQQGLMYRTTLKKNEGMLFVFPDETYRSFWMKNTYIDLAIGYFDRKKRLIEVIEMKATSVMTTNFPSYRSSAPAMYALEASKNWFAEKKIKTGAQLLYKP
jgi:uncharacterized protein